jgi:hypothetical protein
MNAGYWSSDSLCILVDGEEAVDVDKPYARLGAHSAAEVHIPGFSKARSLLLLALGGRIYAAALSESDVVGKSHRWLDAGEEVIVSGHRVSASIIPGEETAAPSESEREHVVPLTLHVGNQGKRIAKHRFDRNLVTIVGRTRPSHVRIRHEDVSACHCALLWSGGRLWAMDLLSNRGTTLASRPLDCSPIDSRALLKLGDVHVEVEVGTEAGDATTWSDPLAIGEEMLEADGRGSEIVPSRPPPASERHEQGAAPELAARRQETAAPDAAPEHPEGPPPPPAEHDVARSTTPPGFESQHRAVATVRESLEEVTADPSPHEHPLREAGLREESQHALKREIALPTETVRRYDDAQRRAQAQVVPLKQLVVDQERAKRESDHGEQESLIRQQEILDQQREQLEAERAEREWEGQEWEQPWRQSDEDLALSHHLLDDERSQLATDRAAAECAREANESLRVDLEQRWAELDQRLEAVEGARKSLSNERDAWEAQRRDVEQQLEADRSALAEQRESHAREADERLSLITREQSRLEQLTASLEARSEELDRQRAEIASRQASLEEQLSTKRQRLEEQRRAHDAEREAEERQSRARDSDSLERGQQASREMAALRQAFEEDYRRRQAELTAQREALETQQMALAVEREHFEQQRDVLAGRTAADEQGQAAASADRRLDTDEQEPGETVESSDRQPQEKSDATEAADSLAASITRPARPGSPHRLQQPDLPLRLMQRTVNREWEPHRGIGWWLFGGVVLVAILVAAMIALLPHVLEA